MLENEGKCPMTKRMIKYIIIFFFVSFFLAGLLVLSAKIPQSSIREKMRESAEFLCKDEVFTQAIKGINGSRIDRYADSILLGIAYQYQEEEPLKSVMWSKFYHEDFCNENENLLKAVTQNCPANQEYLRYWHGANAVVRPLLLYFNLEQIYFINGLALVVLTLWLVFRLIQKKAVSSLVGITTGLVATSVWFVPLCLEYTWTYLLMLLFSIIGIWIVDKNRKTQEGAFFLINGMITNYMDFLTTETLTLTVPLLLMLSLKHKDGEYGKYAFRCAGGNALLWLAGYIGMWFMKWGMASVVLSENTMPYVSGHVGERLSGNVGLKPGEDSVLAVWKNIKCLFPFEYDIIGLLVGIGILLATLYVGYVYHSKHVDRVWILLFGMIGLIPYARYLVLHNHSYVHSFFTYRAQLATILAWILILEQRVKPTFGLDKH